MLDQEQIDAPQFADSREDCAKTPRIEAAPANPFSPASLMLAPMVMTGALMKAMIESQTKSSALENIRWRREQDRRVREENLMDPDNHSPSF